MSKKMWDLRQDSQFHEEDPFFLNKLVISWDATVHTIDFITTNKVFARNKDFSW